MADRDLRQLVVRLAALLPEDREAVLGGLDPRQRPVVERLLREFMGEAEPEPPPVPVPGCDTLKLSPWLAERMSDQSCAKMTPHAREALRAGAIALYPKPPQPAREPGFFSRIAQLVTGSA